MGLSTNLKNVMGQHIGASPNVTTEHIRGLPLAQLRFVYFSYNDADSDDEGFGRACNPPLTRVPRSRPRKQRQDKDNYRATRWVGAVDLVDRGDGQREKRTAICGTCGEEGHYVLHAVELTIDIYVTSIYRSTR